MDDVKHIISRLLGENDDESDWKEVSTPPEDDPYERWFNTYKPIKNTVTSRGSFDGYMFETFGDELTFVRAAKPEHVWTYVTGDNNEDIICAGFHFVNRMGFFITEYPWKDESEAYTFGEGDPKTAEEAAVKILNTELPLDWKAPWNNLTPENKTDFVADFLEIQGLELDPAEVISFLDLWAV